MITVRPTAKKDVFELWLIQRQAFYPLFKRYKDKSNPYKKGIKDIYKRINHPSFKYFTIFENNRIVGGLFYKCNGKTPFCELLKDGMYYLGRVYIKPRRQCNGIAQQAILLSEKLLQDAKVLMVDFPQDLAKNRRCYEKCGYTDTGKRLETDPGVVLVCFEKRI